MKRLLAIILAITMLVLTGCGSNTAPAETEAQPVETTEAPVETTVPTEPAPTEPPVPETVSASVQADRTAVVLTTVNRGDTVDIVGEYDDAYYVVKLETGYGLIEKRLVRMDGEAAYEEWEGFANYSAKLYPTYEMRVTEGEALNLNTKIQVLDNMGGILVVQVGETIGYMEEKLVSAGYIQPYSGGSIDGGDIVLGIQGGITNLSVIAPQTGDVTGKATVLADGVNILLGWFDRDEAVQVITEEGFAEAREGFSAIYLDGLYGYIQDLFLVQEGQEPYAQWNGFAKSGAVLYPSYSLSGEGVKLNTNTELQILADLGDCYLVLADDTMGYMLKDVVSETRIVYSGGGGGTGGGEWTPPMM